MDFSWVPNFGGFWILPLLCLLFMAVMMIACSGMLFRCRHGARRGEGHEMAVDRRFANGETGKKQYDASEAANPPVVKH